MDEATTATMRECARASDEERISFPEVVGRLMQAGIEGYFADLRRAERIFYMPDGESLRVAAHRSATAAGAAFRPDGIQAALRAIQGGEIGYRTFCERILAAGCVGYIVSLAGRRAVYFGRTAECYTEHFPPPPK